MMGKLSNIQVESLERLLQRLDAAIALSECGEYHRDLRIETVAANPSARFTAPAYAFKLLADAGREALSQAKGRTE